MSDTAKELAELVLSMGMVTPAGVHARDLARKILAIPYKTPDIDEVAITTNGTTRIIPRAEPVFLLRGQDALASDTVMHWVNLAQRERVPIERVIKAMETAVAMRDWRPKKLPD